MSESPRKCLSTNLKSILAGGQQLALPIERLNLVGMVAFLLFIGLQPCGAKILTLINPNLTLNNLSKATVKMQRNPSRHQTDQVRKFKNYYSDNIIKTTIVRNINIASKNSLKHDQNQ